MSEYCNVGKSDVFSGETVSVVIIENDDSQQQG